jgi:uncharacterized membrane protein
MYGWLVASVVALLGTVVAWYYKTKANTSQTQVTAALIAANTETLTKVSELLAALTAKADTETKADNEHAASISTAPAAADFLRDSGARARAQSRVRAAIRAPGPCFVTGFCR